MPTNKAAWMTAKGAKPLEVKSAPYTPPSKDEIVVKNAAIALNPIDYLLQTTFGRFVFPWLKYPLIIGMDVAGEVVEVGKGATPFNVGDRVVGLAACTDKRSNGNHEGAFQQYTVLRTNLASPIPDSLSYEKACVLPLGLSTAACGMFMKDYLGLQYPSVSPHPNGVTLLIWGGSTSVGSNAIQLAVAAGYEVISTASPKNFHYVKKLGASEVFDYNSVTVVEDISKALANKQCAGALALGGTSLLPCIDIIATTKGKKFVAQASVPVPESIPSSTLGMIPAMLPMVWFNVSAGVKSRLKGVDFKFIFGSDLIANEVGRVIFEDFLPAALAQGKYVAAPEPKVVGKGLESIQEAMNTLQKGVSAKKLVVTL